MTWCDIYIRKQKYSDVHYASGTGYSAGYSTCTGFGFGTKDTDNIMCHGYGKGDGDGNGSSDFRGGYIVDRNGNRFHPD